MERVYVVSAFADIRGFGSWTYRAANSRELKDPFIQQFYDSMQAYVKANTDVHFKYLGDGFMALKEVPLNAKRSETVFEFIKGLRCIYRKIRKDIAHCNWPAPDGFRIRIADGVACKLMVLDPGDPERKRVISEFVEYVTNTAQRLLQVDPEIPCLVTGGVVTALGKRAPLLGVRHLGQPKEIPKGVNFEDLQELSRLKF